MQAKLLEKVFDLSRPDIREKVLLLASIYKPDPEWLASLSTAFDLTREELTVVSLMSRIPFRVKLEHLDYIAHIIRTTSDSPETQTGAALIAAFAIVRCETMPDDIVAFHDSIVIEDK